MQFIDTHIHLQDYKTKSAPQLIAAAADFGVKKMICVTSREDEWPLAAEWHRQFPEKVIPAFGLHPWYLDELKSGWEKRLEALLEQYPGALIGEAGLDRLQNPELLPQKTVFAEQIELAKQFRRPLLIHAIKAVEWLEDFWPRLPLKFVFHSFNGKKELLSRIIAAGGMVSLAPSLLRQPGKEKMMAAIPAERLLLETDGPYQGEPSQLPALLEYIAAVRGEKAEELAARIYQNTEELINVR